MQSINSNRVADAAALLTSTAGIYVTEIFEQNLKTVSEIYLATIDKGIYLFSPAEEETLLSIAEQCVYSGGKAVILPRALYASVDPIFISMTRIFAYKMELHLEN